MIPKPPPEPPPLSRETEAELRRLEKAILPGPWFALEGTVCDPAGSVTVGLDPDDRQDEITADFIAAVRNHLPALLDQIASDREMREEAAKGLELIAGFAGKTLLGPQSDRECELAHQTGAAQAFYQAAEIASDTLAKLRTAVPADEELRRHSDIAREGAAP